MAYMNQERKKELAPAIKAVLKKYSMKGTISVNNHSTLVVTLKEGKFRFNKDHLSVNVYWINEHYTGELKDFLNELHTAMKGDKWYDKSDSMVDYFDTAYYIEINVGRWDKPYVCTEKEAA